MFRMLTTRCARSFNRVSIVHQREALKPNSDFVTTPSILKHYVKCFSTADQHWKYGQCTKDNNDGRIPVLCVSPFSTRYLSKRQISTDDLRKGIVEVISSLKNLKDAPLPALAIGVAVLSPVMLPTAYMVTVGVCSPSLSFFQMSYTAALLAFHGGSQWGLVLGKERHGSVDWVNFVHIASPPLAAGSALMLPTPFSVFVLMGGLAGSTYYSNKLTGYPPWFNAMWIVLGAGAILSVATAMACRFYLKPDIGICETQNNDIKDSKSTSVATVSSVRNDEDDSQCTYDSFSSKRKEDTVDSKNHDYECVVIPSCTIVPK